MRRFLFQNYQLPFIASEGAGSMYMHGVSFRNLKMLTRALAAKGYKVPQNYILVRLEGGATVQAVYYMGVIGRLMITATSIARGYGIGRSIQGFLAIVKDAAHQESPMLVEIRHTPQAWWLADEVVGPTGTLLIEQELRLLPGYVTRIANDDNIRRALTQLSLSRSIFYGEDASSDQRHGPRSMHRRNWERDYLEHQDLYETAYVAAFKGIEAFLGSYNKTIKKADIAKLLSGTNYTRVRSSTIYRRQHEVISKLRKRETFEAMVGHFLRIRNSTAAHANKTPPREMMVRIHTIYEIQLFVKKLCSTALGDVEPVSLSPKAYVGQHLS
jgi:hypothetical protein